MGIVVRLAGGEEVEEPFGSQDSHGQGKSIDVGVWFYPQHCMVLSSSMPNTIGYSPGGP